MNEEQHAEFPVGRAFLAKHEESVDSGSGHADEFMPNAGEKLPATLESLGTLLSLMYRAATCAWGCRGGDHQIEWLVGRVVNQSLSSYRLIRGAFYDESLVLTRGIGEIANLLWLFNADSGSLDQWARSDRRARLREFGPSKVRKRLKGVTPVDAPIDDERYHKLCEVGTHPIPGFAPGHYSGTGRPVLGVVLQPVGVFVTVNELSYAAAMSAIPLASLLGLDEEVAQEIRERSLQVMMDAGAFTVLNYEELLAKAIACHGAT